MQVTGPRLREIAKGDRSRAVEVGQTLPAEGDGVGLDGLGAGIEADEGFAALAPGFGGVADEGGLECDGGETPA
jgi:hypothetical protein